MAISVLFAAIGSLSAAAVTQSQIDALKIQLQEIEKKKTELQGQINSLEFDQSTALAKKNVLDDRIQYTQEEIANLTEQIAQYDELIAAKETEAANAQQAADDQLQLLKARMRAMEESGPISYISVVFDASSFADLLSNLYIINEIMQSDEQIYENFKLAQQQAVEKKASLEQSKTDKQGEVAMLEVKEGELQEQRQQADDLILSIKNDIEAANALYEQESAEGQDIQNDINNKVAQLQRQQSVVGTGTLIWPTPSCYIVTSEFGMRLHPIYHEYRMHNGIDIGARYGAAVLASDGGTVITSRYSSSYGNYIVISHGNGYTTLYAHLSKRYVSEGDKVDQGETIGLIGSTGASTGAHLHYEVSVNGERTNPLKYFSGYEIW